MKQTSTLKDVKCPKCHSDAVKNGKDSGKQRYRCKSLVCRCNFRKPVSRTLDNETEKRRCMIMYLAGVSVRDIYATLKIEQQTIRRWIDKYGSSLEPIVNKNGYVFQQIKATYLSDKEKIETEIRTGIVFVERFGKVIVSPLEKTPIFYSLKGDRC